jgi:hypothetical protein
MAASASKLLQNLQHTIVSSARYGAEGHLNWKVRRSALVTHEDASHAREASDVSGNRTTLQGSARTIGMGLDMRVR